MRKILFPIIILISILQISSCEKDDICVEGDTPLLVVGFFDAEAEDTTTAKSVENLGIVDIQGSILLNSIGSIDSIAFPLRNDISSTALQFYRNAEVTEEEGTTTISGEFNEVEFTYEVTRNFVSRACGFVANYNSLDTIRQVNETDWIQRIVLINNNIENSNNIHVKIFH